MSETLHLVKIPLRPDRLAAVARRRKLPLREFDDGYLCHCALRELWQERAPAPFVVRGRGRTLDVWAYSAADAATLIDHARVFGDPATLPIIADLDSVASKPVPKLDAGRRVGFVLRACPVVRLGRGTTVHRPGAEVDAFIARALAAGPETPVSREDVYREWLTERFKPADKTGVTLGTIRIMGFARERLLRRTQGDVRQARTLERPDVQFEGDLTVTDGDRFLRWLAHGVGRHRAFGFGALLLVPPGTSSPR